MTHAPHDTPHDTLVKRFFKHPEHVLGILQAALPTTFVSKADWSTLALCSSSLIDRRSRARYGDLLFSVRMRGSRRLVYILLEHQSTFDRSLPWRTRGYEDGIWIWLNRGRKRVHSLPRILTVVLYHGARPWHGPVRLSDLFDTDGQDLDQDHPRLFLIDVPRHTDAELRGMGATAIARLILFCLKHARSPTFFARAEEHTVLFRAVRRDRSQGDAIEAFVEYILLVKRHANQAALLPWLTRIIGEESHIMVKTIGEQLIERGRRIGLKQGREEGREEGHEKGQREIVMRQLTKRFGKLPASARKRIESATAATLSRWADRVLDARSLAEVLGPSA